LAPGKAYAAIVATFVSSSEYRARRFFANVGLTQALTPFPPGPTTPYLDDFNRSDEAPLVQAIQGTNQWSLLSATGEDLRLLSNVAAHGATGTGTGRRYRNVAAWTALADQEAYFFVATKAGNTDGYGALTRLHDLALDTWDGYELMALTQSGTDTVELRRIDNGVVTVLATYNQEHAVGDAFLLRSVGSTHDAWYYNVSTQGWTKLGTVTDATYTAGPPGLSIRNTTARVDNYGGGPFAARGRGLRFFSNVGITQAQPRIVQPSFVDAQAATTGIPAATTLGVPAPAGLVRKDLILLGIIFASGAGTVTPPAGFTSVLTSGRFTLYKKVATASEPATYTFSWTSATNAELQVVAYRDAEDIDASNLTVDAGNVTTHTTGTVTSTRNNDALVLFAVFDSGAAVTPVTGWIERTDAGTGGGGPSMEIQDLLDPQNDAGVKGPFSFTTSSNLARMALLALKPYDYGRRRARRFMAEVALIDTLTVTQTLADELGRGAIANYHDEVLADSPVAYFRLGDTSGTTAVDSSTNANNGTYSGSPSLNAPGVVNAPDGDGGVSFSSGLSQRMSNSRIAAYDVADIFTMEAWIRTNAVGAVNAGIFSRGNNGPYIRTTSGALHFVKSNISVIAIGPKVNDNYFHHIVWTKSGAANHFYLDGVEIFPAVTNATMTNPATVGLAVGADWNGTAAFREFFDGVIDEVALYSTVLSPARVTAHYNAARKSGLKPMGGRSVATANASGSGNLSVTKPAAVQDGDLLIAEVTNFLNGDVTAAPVGMVALLDTQQWRTGTSGGIPGDSKVRIYTKIASSEPSTWTWNFSSSVQKVAVGMFRGPISATPDQWSVRKMTSGGQWFGTTITPTIDQSLIVSVAALRDSSATIAAPGTPGA
jgi:hypothetical protein